jgi:hypothetical protein
MNLIKRRTLLVILAAALLLAACSTSTPTPAAPVPTRLPALFNDVLEMQFYQPGAPLPDGPVAGLVGAYATPSAGENTLLLCQLDGATVQCSRYPVALDGIAPGLVKVSGQMAGGVLTVSQAEPLAWDETAQRAAAQAKLDGIAEELARYDWSFIAAPEFEESSAWFRPDSARLKTIPLGLYAYDSVDDLVIWRGQGWELPKQTRTVHRFPVLYFVTDPAGERLTEAFITIEGYTEE